MMLVYVNNIPQNCEEGWVLQRWIAQQALAPHFAIAINQSLVPRALYDSTLLKEGDHVDIIVPMQGG